MPTFWMLAACGLTACAAPTAPAAAAVPYRIRVREAPRQPAPALQSFAHAVVDDRWLLVGGRTNGYHRTSDRESRFPSRLSNGSLHVVDPVRGASWNLPISEPFRARLRATNTAFCQHGRVLYVIGGYGAAVDDDRPESYQTFPTLTAIRVPEAMSAIVAGRPADLAANICSIEDERMRVTGGELKTVGDRFYLLFGQDYDGVYRGAYTGKYTAEIRRFTISSGAGGLRIADYAAFGDPQGPSPGSPFRRRDLVVTEAVRPDGRLGLTALGGVFTRTGGAWANPIHLDQDAAGRTTVAIDRSFEQKMSQYRCAHLVTWDETTRTHYTTLFGGISLYYLDAQGRLTRSDVNNFMPFISTITTLARGPDGTTVEVPQAPGESLPRRLGAGAAFIPLGSIPRRGGSHDVIDLRKLPAAREVRLGHLYGGILATADQASQFNPTYASSTIYEVLLEPTMPAG